MSIILAIKQITKSFNGVIALNNLSLAIEERQIVSLIGPNGAGKTTLFNIVCGFLPASSGTVLFKGKAINSMATYKIASLGIGRTFQDLRLLRKASLLENVMLGFQHQSGEEVLRGLIDWRVGREETINRAKASSILEFVGLSAKRFDLADSLSYGQQKLLTLAICLATDSELLLLDEPVGGIDPQTTEKILGLIWQLREDGKTVFLIEHNIEAVTSVSDEIIVLDEGNLIIEGPVPTVMKDPRVLEAYLT